MLYQGRDGQIYRRFEQHSFPPTDTPSPARAAHVELAWHDPAGARRERLEAQVNYWRRRLQVLHDRAEALKAFREKTALATAEADELEAARRLEDVEAAAHAAGIDLAPFVLQDAPRPEPLPTESAEPKRRGPKIGCECGSCRRCKARERWRSRRAAAKAAGA